MRSVVVSICCLLWLFSCSSQDTDRKVTPGPADGITITLGVYEDSKCEKVRTNGDEVHIGKLNTSLGCQTNYYTNSKGEKTPASSGNFRCYKDHVIFDKFPLSETCDYSGSKVRTDYYISNKCQPAPSHEGTVYEKLIDYKFPGNENCSPKAP